MESASIGWKFKSLSSSIRGRNIRSSAYLLSSVWSLAKGFTPPRLSVTPILMIFSPSAATAGPAPVPSPSAAASPFAVFSPAASPAAASFAAELSASAPFPSLPAPPHATADTAMTRIRNRLNSRPLIFFIVSPPFSKRSVAKCFVSVTLPHRFPLVIFAFLFFPNRLSIA